MIRGSLLIGWAAGDITPDAKTLLAGQFHARLSRGTLSPLTATALAIEVTQSPENREQVVFLSCDLTHDDIKPDLIRMMQGRCPDLDPKKITLQCTHTHTAPALRRGVYEEPEAEAGFLNPDECRIATAKKLADIVESAWNAREPGTLSRGFSYAVTGRCRRSVYEDGSALMYGDTSVPAFRGFESCADNAVNMLFTRNADGILTGMLINLACPAQCHEQLEVYSADFWHNVRQEVGDTYGEGVHVLPQCAPAGDMSPHLLMDQREEADLRNRLELDDCGIITRRLMAAVVEGLASSSAPESTLSVDHRVETWLLPRLKVTREEYELEKRIPDMNDEERGQQDYAFQRIWPFGPVCNLVERFEQQGDHPMHKIETHIIRLGDVVFATNPFELYVDYGTRIRCRSKALQTFLVQLADGSDLGSYLPTQRALDGGHYSALIKSCWVGPEGGQVFVDRTIGAINTLFEEANYPVTR